MCDAHGGVVTPLQARAQQRNDMSKFKRFMAWLQRNSTGDWWIPAGAIAVSLVILAEITIVLRR